MGGGGGSFRQGASAFYKFPEPSIPGRWDNNRLANVNREQGERGESPLKIFARPSLLPRLVLSFIDRSTFSNIRRRGGEYSRRGATLLPISRPIGDIGGEIFPSFLSLQN